MGGGRDQAKRSVKAAMDGAKAGHDDAPLVRIIFGRHGLLLIFFLVCCSPGFVSAQDPGFSFNTLDDTTMNCTGQATMTPALEGVRRAACLTPFPCSNSTGKPLNPIVGQCSYLKPIPMLPSRSFSTMFSFNTLKFPTYNYGQGFTFFISPVDYQYRSGDSGGYLGWLNSSTDGDQFGNNFAVEFDLVSNTTGGFDDPPQSHVGVNVNSLNSIKTVDVDPEKLASLSSTATLYVWIDYDGVRKWIDVRLSTTDKKPCGTIISIDLDLSLVLLDTMYLGFSSSTGGTGLNDSTQYNSQTTVWDWSFNPLGKVRHYKLCRCLIDGLQGHDGLQL